MSYTGYPEGVTGAESYFAPVDTVTIPATCPYPDCDFDGDVQADVFLLYPGTHERIFEYEWACPKCGAENEEERTYRDGEDD